MDAVDLKKGSPKKEIKPTLTPVTKNPSLASLEEKVDRILKHQKWVRGIAIFRGAVSFIFLLVFIILPLIGGFYLYDLFKEQVDLEKLGSQYIQFIEAFEEFKSNAAQIGGLKELLSGKK